MNPPADEPLMIRPPPRETIDSSTAFEHTTAPITFTRITRSNHSVGRSIRLDAGSSVMSAALFTRMSIPPNRSTTCATMAVADTGSVTSSCTPIAAKPSASSSAAAATAASPSRSANATEPPASAIARPYTVPIPPHRR